MKILVLVMYYWPDETGIAGFLTRRCEYLASCGHEVTVCTGFPFYPQWRIAREYRGRLFQRESHNGVKIVRSYLFVPHRVTSAKRIIHEASFVASAIPAALTRHKPDLILVVSPPLGLALGGVLLSRIWRVPYVFHVEDLQPDAASDLNMLKSRYLLKALFALERMAYRNAAMVSTLTDGMRQRILSKGVAPDKVPVFRHWSDPALFMIRPMEDGKAFRRSVGVDGNFLVTHSGNMGVKQGLDVILEAARLYSANRDIRNLIVGDGAVREALEAKARTLNLSNVTFLPLQNSEAFRGLLAATDLSLVTQQRCVGDIVFPSKVTTIMAAGACPIVASLNSGSEIARVVTEANAGVVTAAEDAHALAEAIVALQSQPETRLTMKENGRAYARRMWDGEKTLPAMEKKLLDVVGARHSSVDAADPKSAQRGVRESES